MLIQRMRDGSEGVLAKIIIGLIIIVFALFGFGSITTFLAPVPKVATVNGEDVSQQDMEMAVERNRRMLMARDVPQDEIDEDQLREDVLQSLIAREILTQAAGDLDLYYSDAALDEEIVTSQVFQIDGVFNPDQFQRVIAGTGYSPLSYRAEMRTDKLFDQMISGIRDSAFLTDEETKRYAGLLSQRRDIAWIQIAVTDLLDEVVVSEEELEAFYNNNTGEFITEETVNIQYIELRRDELAASFEVDENELIDYFEENRGAWSTDETRRLAHILIETGDSEVQALERANEVHGRILDGGEFSALAKEFSDDLGSSENGGDLGFNEQGTFYPEFEAVAYDLALDQVSAPVETEIGYHIIKVLGIEEASIPELSDVRAEVEQMFRLVATEDEFVNKSSRMAEMLFENFSELETTADELGLQVRTTGDLARDASHALMSVKHVADAAFSPDVLLDGNNSDLIEIDDDYHLGLRVLEHKPSETLPFEEVREDVRYILQREKATKLASVKAQQIVDAVAAGSLAQYVADEYGVEWRLVAAASRFQQDIEPLVLAEAFKLPRPADNKESLGSATLPNGDSVVLRVSTVINKPESELTEQEMTTIQLSLTGQLGSNDFQDFQKSLEKEASLERVN